MEARITPPLISLWYGDKQSFGHGGQPQRWVNILGRVYGDDVHLSYSLNGSALKKISVGPDQRRLPGVGDFNIDLDSDTLLGGENVIVIKASDSEGVEVEKMLSLDYQEASTSLPCQITWETIDNLEDAVHVVDGLWSVQDQQISPVEIGYDRLLAIGDQRWRDYQVSVPITLHGYNSSCYEFPSVHAGVGVVLRWQGHSNWGEDAYASGQPHFGPSPYGMIGWYCVFHQDGPLLNFFDPDFNRAAEIPFDMVLHQPYMFKLRVETVDQGKSIYAMKVWDIADEEPSGWDLEVAGTEKSLDRGSIVLGAHHVSASFGEVYIEPLQAGE